MNGGTVMVYAVHTRLWRTLPPYENHYFGMAAVNKQLVLIGGLSISSGKLINALGVWDEGSQAWTHPFPEMPTSRYSSSVVSYQKWLIVADGACLGKIRCSNKVELLDTLSGQWYEGSPLPNECSEMSSAINGNMWYLSGGFSSKGPNIVDIFDNKHLFSVCLDELVSQTLSRNLANGGTTLPSPWQTLNDPPLKNSTALVLNGTLLTVGGSRNTDIYCYQPSNRKQMGQDW